MIFFVLLVGWIASAFFCASVASEKGYSGTSWGIAGFLFGFFALIAVDPNGKWLSARGKGGGLALWVKDK